MSTVKHFLQLLGLIHTFIELDICFHFWHFLFHILVGICSFCLSVINYFNMFHLPCINQVPYTQITNNIHFVFNDVYIINNEVNFVGVLSIIENCLFMRK